MPFHALLPALLFATAVYAVDPPIWVQQTDGEFITAADFNNDGSVDIAVVDRATGLVRRGHPAKYGIVWDATGTSGIAPVDGAACGRFLDVNRYALALCGETANRIGVMNLDAAGGLYDVYSVFPYQLAPVSLTGLDAVPSAGDELFCIARLTGDSTTYIKIHTSLPSGGFNSVDSTSNTKSYHYSGAVQPEAGGVPIVAAIKGTSNQLQLFGTNTHSATEGDYYEDLAITEDSRFIFGHYLAATPVGQFLVYTPGSLSALVLPLKPDGSGGYEFNTAMAYSIILPLTFATLNPGPDSGEVTVITTSGAVKVVAFNGTNFTTVTDLTVPLGSECVGAVPIPGATALYTLFDGNGDGISDSARAFVKISGNYQANMSVTQLPALSAATSTANILFFDGEPLVDTNISRVAAYRVKSWTTVNPGTPPLSEVRSLTDGGTSSGLGSPTLSSVNYLPPAATHQMVNQLTSDSSASALFAAVGESFSEVIFSPAGGVFDQAVQLTLTAPDPMNRIIVKIGNASWMTYSGPIWLFLDAQVSALAYNYATGRTTPIRSVSFAFTKSPEEMDSDNDGVPDFAEIDSGIDPDSGSDADDDGISDLDELINGTDPNDADSDGDGWTDRQELQAGTDPNDEHDEPASEEDLLNSLISAEEKQALFDLRVSPVPVDGTIPAFTRCATGATCRAYSFSGALLGVDISRNNGFAGVADASVAFTGLSTPMQAGLFALATPSHFNVSTPASDKMIGRELVALARPPELSETTPAYSWSGGSTHTETLAWISAAQTAYGASSRPVSSREMEYTDTVAALLLEALAARELYARGEIATNAASLFPHRTEPESLPHPGDDLIASLAARGPGGEDAFIPSESHEWLLSMVSTGQTASVVMLRSLALEIYEISSAENNDAPGLYPLPVDALRQLILAGTLPGGYTNLVGAADITLAAQGAADLLAGVPARPEVTLSLPAHNHGGNGQTVLLDPDSGLTYNLVNSENDPFPMEFAFALPTNATVLIYGFLNSDPGTSGADREVEVIEMTVTALPSVTPQDQDPNLLPDAYEMLTFGSTGASPDRDSDGDGFSELQEYLEGTDPTSALSAPATPAEDIGIPTVLIDSATGTVEISLDWPARYQSAFHFQLESTDDLASPFTEHPTAVLSGDGDRMRVNLSQGAEGAKRFYRVKVSLR